MSCFDRAPFPGKHKLFPIAEVAPVTGFSLNFIRRAIGNKAALDVDDVLALLDQDAFAETFIPRSRVVAYLVCLVDPPSFASSPVANAELERGLQARNFVLEKQDALDFLRSLPARSVQCVVTSTPYWALRIYNGSVNTHWADGSCCPYGHEQTPESFIRHSSEILSEVHRVLKEDGSVWWNVMDSFNTRTQIRSNAVEALRAMQGKDKRTWSQHDCRRYSSGHAYLKDGEQCLIPSRIAERASRTGFFVKTVITWAKTATLPEPQNSRVSRNLEYILHLTKVRTPKFNKDVYLQLPAALGGRNNDSETKKLSDVWTLSTSNGRDGHGAQFPVALPCRCIALSTDAGDLVLDPFVGAGNSGVAALTLGRRFVGVDVSQQYLDTARGKLKAAVRDPKGSSLGANGVQCRVRGRD